MSDRLLELNNDLGRLGTFISWPKDSPAWPSALALAGFYYQGNCDETRCHRCACAIRDWQSRGDPFEEHWKENSYCSFLAETTMKNETARLGTFGSWPLSHLVRPEELARAGLYFLGVADKVKCAFCQNVLHQWEEGDITEGEHRRHFPECPLVQGLDVGNIPIDQGAAATNGTPLLTQQTILQQGYLNNRSTVATLGSSSGESSFGNNPSTFATLGSSSGESSVGNNPSTFATLGSSSGESSFGNNPSTVATLGSSSGESSVEESEPQLMSEDFVALDMSFPQLQPVSQDIPIPELPQVSQAQSLSVENRQLREEILCIVCFVEEANLAFLPCGHLCSCHGCLGRLNRCPLCRSEYSGTVSVKRN